MSGLPFLEHNNAFIGRGLDSFALMAGLGAMDMAEELKLSPGQKLRRVALFALFASVLLIPKTLALRRRRRVWNTLRAAAAITGALLVVVPMGLWSSWLAAAVGLVLFVMALLLDPLDPEKSVDEHARELGALVVVNGGRFHAPSGPPVRARLFVAPKRVVALDASKRQLVEIPFGELSSVHAEEANGGWKLRVEWDHQSAEFSYEGFFAEHLARVAETTLRNQAYPGLPVLK